MNNLFTYIEQNKDIPFSIKDFTEVDVLLFSQLSYLNLENLSFSHKQKYSLIEVKKLINRKKNKNIFLGEASVLKLLDSIANTQRYKEIQIANYVYITNANTQFGAMTIFLPNHTYFVSFEGTDYTISGWKEDAELSYFYPTEAQRKAGEYLSEIISQVKKPLYVCGHSKGGNLAVVGSMRTLIEERNKIVKIYSFDGPGLRESEFVSTVYQNIQNRIKHYIPEESVIGVLFLQKKPTVIKSSSIGILQHSAFSWQIAGDYIERGRQSRLSKELELAITTWLKKYNLKEREKIVNSLFSAFLKAGITDFYQLTNIKEKSLFRFLSSIGELSEETKDVIRSFFLLIVGEILKEKLLKI